MDYSFDTVCTYIEEYLFCDRYSQDELFYIDFFGDDPIIEVFTLEEKGYDLNEDGTVYRDSNGRPVNTSMNKHYHLAEDITILDETGKRVPNIEYINQLILRDFSLK